jgi:hypothetical protein
MFTFEKVGTKIAQIHGGKRDKEFVYLSEPSDTVKNGYEEIKLDDGAIMQPLPNKKIVEKVYVSAPSGSGKSVYSGKWLKQLHKMDRDMPIYCFSPIPEDKALDFLPIERVDLDEHLINNPMTVEELQDCCVIFDDCESIKCPRMRKYITWLRDSILETGRHYNVRMIWISHLISNFTDTRRLLNESTSVTVFPKSGSGVYQIKQFLKNQCGLDRNEIKRFINLPSRWCTIYRSYPQFVMHEKGCYFPKLCDD